MIPRKTDLIDVPSIHSVTRDRFSVGITSSLQSGVWGWRAKGKLLKPRAD